MGLEAVKILSPHSLGPAEIHVWYLRRESVPLQAFEDAFYSLTPASDHKKYEQFLFLPKRREFMMTRVFLRNVLSRYVDIAPSRWDFQTNAYGCPSVLYPPLSSPLNFNISHTEGLITVAIGLGREIGVDVENRTREIAALDLAQSAFSPEEAREIQALMPWERTRRFYEFWTLKEAYIKARGMGMQIPTDQFSILSLQGKIEISYAAGVEEMPKTWGFQLLEPSEAHQGALAFRKKNATELVDLREFEYDPAIDLVKQELKIA